MENITRSGWLQRHVLLAAILIPLISVLIGSWIEQAAIWSDDWRQVLRSAGTMSPFAASVHTLLTLAVERVGGIVFKAWEEHKERMAEMRRRGLEEGREEGRAEGRQEGRLEGRQEGREVGRAEALAEYERRWERARQAVMERTGEDLDVLLNGNHADAAESSDV